MYILTSQNKIIIVILLNYTIFLYSSFVVIVLSCVFELHLTRLLILFSPLLECYNSLGILKSKYGCFSSCSDVGRSRALRLKHLSRKSYTSSDPSFSASFGIASGHPYEQTIRCITCIIFPPPVHGRWPVNIYATVHPADQISALKGSYPCSSVITYGAIQSGVPANVLVAALFRVE